MRILHFVLIGCVLFLLLAIVGAIKGLKFPQGQIQSSIQGQVQIIKPVPGTIVVPNQNPLNLIRDCNIDYPWKPFYEDDLYLSKGYGFVTDASRALREMADAALTTKEEFLQRTGKTWINSDLFAELMAIQAPILDRKVILVIMLQFMCLFRSDKTANAILLTEKGVSNPFA